MTFTKLGNVRSIMAMTIAMISIGFSHSAWATVTSPAASASETNATILENWLLVLKSNVDPDAFATALCAPSNPLRKLYSYGCTDTFRILIRGVAGLFSRDAVRDVLKQYKDSIDYAARDQEITVGDQLLTAGEETEQEAWQASTQAGSTRARRAAARLLPEELDPVNWGLDRIDQTALPLDKIYHYDNVGTGVHVYVLDSGIRATHQQFRTMAPLSAQRAGQPVVGLASSRVSSGFSAFGGSSGPDSSTDDCYGHGTHVAAIVGGLDIGVAKNVTLHPVKVLDCFGNANETTLLRGLEWVAGNLQYPAVVHMSLEGYYSGPVNAAVEDLVQRLGVLVVASAGNHNADACSVSPASAQSALAVGAINSDGTRWYKSNWGPCLDIFAPGANVTSAVPWTDASQAPKTGTSMAAPFATGVAALYLASQPGASPADVTQRLLRSALSGAVTDDSSGMATFNPALSSSAPWAPIDISSTPNRLLQSVLTVPARLSPSVLTVASADASQRLSLVGRGLSISLVLLLQPTGQVNVTAAVPTAWNGAPLADIFPSSLTFNPTTFNTSQRLLLQPSAGPAQGSYYVQLSMRSTDPRFDFAVQVVKVEDLRDPLGETADAPRLITSLPFTDSGSTLGFRHDYATSLGNPLDTAPDVVYAFTPPYDMIVTASTCGSSYDTVLLLGQNPLRLDETLSDDDDQGCAPASRIDADLLQGVTYYVVVSGFNGAAGNFVLSVRCVSCDGDGGGGGSSGGGGGQVGAPTRRR